MQNNINTFVLTEESLRREWCKYPDYSEVSFLLLRHVVNRFSSLSDFCFIVLDIASPFLDMDESSGGPSDPFQDYIENYMDASDFITCSETKVVVGEEMFFNMDLIMDDTGVPDISVHYYDFCYNYIERFLKGIFQMLLPIQNFFYLKKGTRICYGLSTEGLVAMVK